MAVFHEDGRRRSSTSAQGLSCLEDKFDVIKEIGDGSFGSVVLARVRAHGSTVARKGTLVAIKTMKKTFESFAPCLELREVIFLRSLPNHIHLVPALDIFLDPLSKKLHICMEHMDGNLYQLMKARDHKLFEPSAVKSILAQIMSGLEHIHAHQFFHRDIKPENILVSASSTESSSNLRRYSTALLTPPATPSTYAVKIADFGLARETHSKLPYTTYVSTRWYRAPEVLLRAGEYSAPVDIWAVGAMAVEIATLKPLFPGGNEVDQVWRVCEVMGSPGNWTNKYGQRVGGGEWKDGTRLAHKLGFQFPKMAPHSIDGVLRAPHWPNSLSQFVTWCLMWDPKVRPTSTRALQHEYFIDAVDPLRPKSANRSSSKTAPDSRTSRLPAETAPPLQSRPSWFRRSFVGRESNIPVAVLSQPEIVPAKPIPTHSISAYHISTGPKPRPTVEKRLTWAGSQGSAPMPILPSIRPLSPLPNAVNAHAAPGSKISGALTETSGNRVRLDLSTDGIPAIHRQSSINQTSASTHDRSNRSTAYGSRLLSPPSSHKENSLFSSWSHIRKRARRISGRNQLSPDAVFDDDIEAAVGCGPWNGIKPSAGAYGDSHATPRDNDSTLSTIRTSLEQSIAAPPNGHRVTPKSHQLPMPTQKALKRQHSMPQAYSGQVPVSSRTRKALHMSKHPALHYDTPNEEEEISPEVDRTKRSSKGRIYAASASTTNIDLALPQPEPPHLKTHYSASDTRIRNPYPTPSPPDRGALPRDPSFQTNGHRWPTPPEEQSDWAVAALQSVYSAAGATYL